MQQSEQDRLRERAAMQVPRSFGSIGSSSGGAGGAGGAGSFFTSGQLLTINGFDRGTQDPSPKEAAMAAQHIKDISASAQPIAIKDKKVISQHVSKLKDLGFTSLHDQVEKIAERAMRENLIGAAGYKKIPETAFEAASIAIRNKSNGNLRLSLTPVEDYLGQHFEEAVMDPKISLPPTEVLDKMSAAKKEGLFDSYSVIHVQKASDPILVGHVKGARDMYFIAEWGDDISVSDIIG